MIRQWLSSKTVFSYDDFTKSTMTATNHNLCVPFFYDHLDYKSYIICALEWPIWLRSVWCIHLFVFRLLLVTFSENQIRLNHDICVSFSPPKKNRFFFIVCTLIFIYLLFFYSTTNDRQQQNFEDSLWEQKKNYTRNHT